MRKILLLATAAVIAGAPFAGSADARDQTDRAAQTANQIVAQEDVRVAQLKANLRLTSDQEKNWPASRAPCATWARHAPTGWSHCRPTAASRKSPPDLIEYLTTRSKRLGDRSADMKKLADAAQPLYASLDDQQKKRLANELMDLSRGRNPD